MELGSSMADHHLTEIPPGSSPSYPSPSMPIHLSGFLSGDTIQVQGDARNLEFSVQFNIHRKRNSHDHFHFPDINFSETQVSLNSSASSYLTPIATHEDEAQGIIAGTPCRASDLVPEEKESNSNNRNSTIVTRLRSGVLLPITYRPRGCDALTGKSFRYKRKSGEKNRGKRDVLEMVLRRRSFPVRPCNSYTFFVMTNWGMVKRSSFEATSKKLGKMWCKLSQDEKKVFEDMALKDTARYKRQCMLLKGNNHEEARTEMLKDWGNWEHMEESS